jgi:TRAP-type C4-dicarboxylate transport system permease small subunit
MIEDLIKLAGLIAAGFAAVLVLLLVALVILAGALMCWGAYESIEHPITPDQMNQSYLDLDQNITAAQNELNRIKYIPSINE